MKYRPTSSALRRFDQRGAATLIVVMVLFFVMSMVAAYTSRNLIFEQKTSANQLRSTQATEAAEAGLQWALGLLNSGRIDEDCRPTNDLTKNSFRQRYLSIDAETGNVTPVTQSDGSTLTPSCVFDGTTWVCSCPVDGAPTVGAPAGNGFFPAYRVRFRSFPGKPTVVRVDVQACTSYVESCLSFTGQGLDNEGRGTARAMVTLKPSLATLPVAALTTKGGVAFGGGSLSLYNTNPRASGITLHAGGALNPASMAFLQLYSAPGTPGARSIRDVDTSVGSLTADQFFVSMFGLSKASYRDQPATVVVNCAGACTAVDLTTAIDRNPQRIIWIEGDLNIDASGDIGSAAEPAVVVVTGAIQFSANATIHGVLYGQAAAWSPSGAITVNGAVIAEGNFGGTSTASFAYDPVVLSTLRNRSGSLLAIPGTWQDF